jgi:hypothetical protein
MKKSTIRKYFKIFENKTSFIFMNTMNVHIELNKMNGEFITGNVEPNENDIKVLMSVANELKNRLTK